MPGVLEKTFARLPGSLQRMNCSFSRARYMARYLAARMSILALLLLVPSCGAQEPSTTLPVNCIYGAYIPKDAPVQPLTGDQRFKLYLRQTYTTPGIYVKTVLFSIHDQVNETDANRQRCELCNRWLGMHVSHASAGSVRPHSRCCIGRDDGG
jgi:hypothetical protein